MTRMRDFPLAQILTGTCGFVIVMVQVAPFSGVTALLHPMEDLPVPFAKTFLALVFALSLHGEAPPVWVLGGGVDPAYPAGLYLTGYGLSSPTGTEAEQREQALAMARAALASTIRTRVQSDFTSRVTQQDQHMSHYAQNLVKTRADLELEGLDTLLVWRDAPKRLTHALAVLDKARTRQLLEDRLKGQAAECGRAFEAARAASDAPGLLRARNLRERMEEGLLVRAVLTEGQAAPILCPSQADITFELRKACEALPGLDRHVALAALDLGSDLPKGVRVLMDRITFADTPFCGTFSDYLEQSLAVQLARLGQVKLIDKTQAADAIRADLGGAPADGPRSQAAVRGVVLDLGEQVKVTLRVTSASGEELASAQVDLPAALVRKAGLKLVPPNYLEARKNLELCDAQVQASKLQVKLALDRGQGGIYRKGDKLHLFLKANMDCYVKVLYHQVDGTKVVIFPNKYHPDAAIHRDQLYQVPPDDNAFDLEVQEPFGIEMVKVIASTDPIPIEGQAPDANGLVVVKEDLQGLLGRTRGIALKKAETQYAEATAVVNTMAATR
jgi:hypothetical protein